MSEIRSDNRLEKHPKPVQEHERKNVSGVYVDWDSFAEMEAVYNIAYRANKYFWVDGLYYQCSSVGVYRLIGGGSSGGGADVVDYTVLADSNGITVSELDGKTFYLAVQGTTPYNSVFVQQTGTFLDFTNVGGVSAGQVITIFFK